MPTWDDEELVIYLLLLLVQHGQNNYFFCRTKLEKICYYVNEHLRIATCRFRIKCLKSAFEKRFILSCG